MTSLRGNHLLHLDGVHFLDGLEKSTQGIEPVVDGILAHRPIFFIGVGCTQHDLAVRVAKLIFGRRGPDHARAWGFTVRGRSVNLGNEPFYFATRCSMECVLRLVLPFLAKFQDALVVVVWKPEAPARESCIQRTEHELEVTH